MTSIGKASPVIPGWCWHGWAHHTSQSPCSDPHMASWSHRAGQKCTRLSSLPPALRLEQPHASLWRLLCNSILLYWAMSKSQLWYIIIIIMLSLFGGQSRALSSSWPGNMLLSDSSPKLLCFLFSVLLFNTDIHRTEKLNWKSSDLHLGSP